MEFILVYRSELEWTKRDDLPFQAGCSAVGFARCLCEVEFRPWPVDFLKSFTIRQILMRWVTACRPVSLGMLV